MLTFRQLREKLEYRKQEGESHLLHHITPHEFDSFKPMSHFGTHDAARARASFLAKHELPSSSDSSHEKYTGSPEIFNKRQKETKFNIYSTRLKLGKVIDVPDIAEDRPSKLLDMLSKHKHIPHETVVELTKKSLGHGGLTHEHIAKALNKHGIDTLRYKNKWEDPGKTSYMITRPDQVRVLRKTKSTLNLKRGWDKLADE